MSEKIVNSIFECEIESGKNTKKIKINVHNIPERNIINQSEENEIESFNSSQINSKSNSSGNSESYSQLNSKCHKSREIVKVGKSILNNLDINSHNDMINISNIQGIISIFHNKKA